MKTHLLTTCLIACCGALVSGCATRPMASPRPASASAPAPEDLFAKPTPFDRARLAGLHSEFEGSVSNLNLSWVSGIGEPAIPTLVQLAGDRTLPALSRNLALVVLGNAMAKAGLYNHPDGRNDLIVPVLYESMGDQDSQVRGSAAYASRFIHDPRLVPVLEALLQDKKGVQEQAVLGLGSNGGQEDVLPIAKLFFATDNGKFRLSCIYALATMSLDRGVDVAGVLRDNKMEFSDEKQSNVQRVTERFAGFEVLRDLVKQLDAPDAATRRQAAEELRARAKAGIVFNPEADEATRAEAIQRWREYLLKDYWRAPRPKTLQPPAPPAGTP